MKTLYRSRTNKMLGGVFGGLGEMLHVDANILRLIYGVLALATGVLPAVVLYIIAWAILPEGAPVTTMPPSTE